ncbi:MAG: type II toxin-antitoxin system RelE/ParE family toxin [Rhizomicrobium sp.]
MTWTVVFVNVIAEAEVQALPLDMQASFARLADMFRDHGLSAMRQPYAKHLAGKLWELRLKGPRRHRAVDLRHGERPAGDRAADVREEDREGRRRARSISRWRA